MKDAYTNDIVWPWIKAHPMEQFTTMEVVIGIGGRVNREQCGSSLCTLANRGSIQRLTRGVYRYIPVTSGNVVAAIPTVGKSRPLYEGVMITAKGTIIVESEEGVLYRLVELDV